MTTLDSFANLWMIAMVRATVAGGVAFLMVGVLCAVLKRLSPAVRCLLWRLGYLKLFLSLLVTATIALPILPAVKPAPTVTVPVSSAPVERVGGVPAVATNTASVTSSPVVRQLPSTPTLVLFLWSLVVLFQLGRLARQWSTATRLRASLRYVADADLLERYRTLSKCLGLTVAPPLTVGPRIESPLLIGIVAPTIALPEDFQETLTLRETEMILAHELAHLRRQDLLWGLLPALAEAFFAFHPLVWLAHRELHLAQEIACDEEAIAATRATGSRYSSVLLRVASGLQTPSTPGFVTAGLTQSFDNIPRRIKAMRYLSTSSNQRRALAVAALTLLGIGGLIPWRATAQEAAPTSGSESVSEAAPTERYTVLPGKPAATPFLVYGTKSSLKTAKGYEVLPNRAILLEVKGQTPEDLLRLSGIAENAKGIDNLGNAISRPQIASRNPILGLRGQGRYEYVFLHFPDKSATSLKSLEGDLLVRTGPLRQFTFQGNQWKAGATQSAGKVSAKISSIQQKKEAVVLGITSQAPVLQQSGIVRSGYGVAVELVDASGKAYSPRFPELSRNFGKITLHRTPGRPIQFLVQDTEVYRFILPSGVKPVGARVSIIEQQGPDKRIPFHLTDIPLK